MLNPEQRASAGEEASKRTGVVRPILISAPLRPLAQAGLMSDENDDTPAQVGFTRTDDFLRDAARLTDLDFAVEPSREEEREEQAALGRLCSMVCSIMPYYARERV